MKYNYEYRITTSDMKPKVYQTKKMAMMAAEKILEREIEVLITKVPVLHTNLKSNKNEQ